MPAKDDGGGGEEEEERLLSQAHAFPKRDLVDERRLGCDFQPGQKKSVTGSGKLLGIARR